MTPFKLSEIVEGYIKEHKLPFYLEDNVLGQDLWTIRKSPRRLANSIGFVSNKHGKVCIYNLSNRPTDNEWLNPINPSFFEQLNARLRLYIDSLQ